MKCHITPAQMREVMDLGWDPHGDVGRVAWLIAEVRRLRGDVAEMKMARRLARLYDLDVHRPRVGADALD
jgi:hypothetical protein